MTLSDLRHTGDQRDDVSHCQGEEVAVGGGVEGPGDCHQHHHHRVPRHSHQENQGLEDCPRQPVQSAVVLGRGTELLVLLPGQDTLLPVLLHVGHETLVTPTGGGESSIHSSMSGRDQ